MSSELTEAQLTKKAHAAARALQIAVDAVQQRYERLREKRNNLPELTEKRKQEIQHTMKRVKYWLTGLLLRQSSFRIAMDCFLTTAWPHYYKSLERELQQYDCINNRDKNLVLEPVRLLLEDLFTQLIRLHDGLILCVSGECRHPGDIAAAKQSKYPSQLNQHSQSIDGVSKLYSSDLNYSGLAWDDFYDDENGIRQILCTQLQKLVAKSRRADIWDVLLETGGQLFDATLDDFQNERDSIQSDFTSFKKRAVTELRLLFQKYGSKVQIELSMADKMEKLYVRLDASKWTFQRLADKFQVVDPAGALPLLYSVEEWTRVLAPSLTKPQSLPNKSKKRKVILDSSESEDEAALKPSLATVNKANSTCKDSSNVVASGLVVNVQHSTVNKIAPIDDEPISLDKIKQQMGVIVEELAEARELVEEEEAVASRAANMIDQAPEDILDLEAGKREVKRLRKKLHQSIRKVKPDIDIWDHRECLREACMNAGNLCLEMTDRSSKIDALEAAMEFFDESQRLVRRQQTLLRHMSDSGAVPEHSIDTLRQQCLLLLGRAQVNSGIARVELSQELTSNEERKNNECQAKIYLDAALGTTQKLIEDIRMHGSTTEAIIDVVVAYELQSLIRLSTGKMLWLKWKRGVSWSIQNLFKHFEEAAEVLRDIVPADTMYDDALFGATLQALVQGYFAWTTFADLAIEYLKDGRLLSIRDDVEKYESVYVAVVKAVEGAASQSKVLYELASDSADARTNELLLTEQEVRPASELLEYLREVSEFWKERRESSVKPMECTNRCQDLGRNDISASDTNPSHSVTGRMVVGLSRKKKKKPKPQAAYSNFGASRHTDDRAPGVSGKTSQPARQYRKWGDQLLPQTIDEHGNSVPKLVFPAIAPEMSTEFKAQWEENLRRVEAMTI